MIVGGPAADVERYLHAALAQIVEEAKKAGSIKLPAAAERPKVANQFAAKPAAAGKAPAAAGRSAGRAVSV